ncbi:hypothetical protein AAKU64_000538 [Undibacterium sp. GrIS 1.8]
MSDLLDIFYVGGILIFFILVALFANVCNKLGETK